MTRGSSPPAFVLLGLLLLPAAGRGDTISSTDSFLPAVHIGGASGVFRTDITIFNPDPSAVAVVDIYYTAADTDGTTSPVYRLPGDLAPAASVQLPDIVLATFGLDSSYGLLEVKSSASTPVIVTSTTYNVAGALPGTYGEFSPGQPLRNAVGFDTSAFGNIVVTGIPNDPVHRTNAAIMNPTGVTLQAGVQLVDSSGKILKTVLAVVPPFSLHQLNDVFNVDFVSAAPLTGGPWRLNFFVNASNGGRALAYATVIDLRTGAPYLLTAQLPEP